METPDWGEIEMLVTSAKNRVMGESKENNGCLVQNIVLFICSWRMPSCFHPVTPHEDGIRITVKV